MLKIAVLSDPPCRYAQTTLGVYTVKRRVSQALRMASKDAARKSEAKKHSQDGSEDRYQRCRHKEPHAQRYRVIIADSRRKFCSVRSRSRNVADIETLGSRIGPLGVKSMKPKVISAALAATRAGNGLRWNAVE